MTFGAVSTAGPRRLPGAGGAATSGAAGMRRAAIRLERTAEGEVAP